MFVVCDEVLHVVVVDSLEEDAAWPPSPVGVPDEAVDAVIGKRADGVRAQGVARQRGDWPGGVMRHRCFERTAAEAACELRARRTEISCQLGLGLPQRMKYQRHTGSAHAE